GPRQQADARMAASAPVKSAPRPFVVQTYACPFKFVLDSLSLLP
ncbi:hypothetical protein ABNIH3_15891, partial [Acinetobacter baumannii ABNIH3]